MSDLVKTLITGFLTSIILLLLVYFFWKLYDRPSKKQLEVEETTREKRKEERMWRAIEADMAREREQIEAQALIQRKQADLRARAQPPAAGVMQTALATLDAPTDGEAYLARFKPDISGIEEILVDENLASTEADDSDVLLAPDIVEVRQDEPLLLENPSDELLVDDTDDSQAIPENSSDGSHQAMDTDQATQSDVTELIDAHNVKQQGDVDAIDGIEPAADGWSVGW